MDEKEIVLSTISGAVDGVYILDKSARLEDVATLACTVRKELKPLDEDMITAFPQAIHGHQFEELFTSPCSRECERARLWGCCGIVWTLPKGPSQLISSCS